MTEERDHFPPGIAEFLGWYVYPLIDPRNARRSTSAKVWEIDSSIPSGKH